MTRIIVSDTTTLITLEKQQRLSLLYELFEQVIIPEAVYNELLAGMLNDAAVKKANCIVVEKVKSSSRLSNLLILIDQGEAEAIELAMTKQIPLIIDEKKGRKIAQQLGINITGLAGLLILAVKRKRLDSAQAKDILDRAIENGHRLSP